MTTQTDQATKQCGVCGEVVIGSERDWAGNWAGQNLINPHKDHAAIRCKNCNVLICKKCEAKNKLWNDWSGYDKSICPKCTQPIHLKTIIVRENYDPKTVFLENSKSSINTTLVVVIVGIIVIVLIAIAGIFFRSSNFGLISLIGVLVFAFAIRLVSKSGIGDLLKFSGNSSKGANQIEIKCSLCGETNFLNGVSFQFKCQNCGKSKYLMLKDIKHRSQVLDEGLSCDNCQTLNPLGQRPAYFECSKCKEIVMLEKVPILQ
jgi:hypothetical protein